MDAFEKLLHEYRTSRFLVVDPEGGMGDELILLGLEKKLQEMKIRYRVLSIRKSPVINKTLARAIDSVPAVQSIIRSVRPDIMERHLRKLVSPLGEVSTTPGSYQSEDVILLRGGAYLNDIWGGYDVLRLMSKAARNNPQSVIIIAPQSFYFKGARFREMLQEVTHDMYVFCREIDSYNLLSPFHHPQTVHIGVSHDTALFVSKADLHVQDKSGGYILVAPRLDRESVVTWRREKMWRAWRTGYICKDVNLLATFKSFVDVVANARKVYTDRLHVSILGAILGKETYLLPNSYHKNKSTYDFSLKSFPNVTFIDTREFPLPKASNTKRSNH